jgi:hypothetical protein
MRVLFLVMGVQNQQCMAQATKSVLMALKKANKPTRICSAAKLHLQRPKR